jgi:hypothetical protein
MNWSAARTDVSRFSHRDALFVLRVHSSVSKQTYFLCWHPYSVCPGNKKGQLLIVYWSSRIFCSGSGRFYSFMAAELIQSPAAFLASALHRVFFLQTPLGFFAALIYH